MATIYYTATSMDGFIATDDHSLEWLLSRDIDHEGPFGFSSFMPGVGASVMGANTYQWMLDNLTDEEQPATGRSWVMTHREFPESEDVTFTSAPIEEVHAELVAEAGEKNVWMIGGGDLAGRFARAGLLDEIWVQYAPVALGSGAPILPHHVELRLVEVAHNRDFVCARYGVVR